MAKILLVDDEAHLLKALEMILSSRNHTVTAVADGRAAESLIKSHSYDLIISDIRMTPVDGLYLLRVVQAVYPETPVILITAHATLDVALEAIKSGAFDFITKPFRTDDLLAAIQRALDYPRIAAGIIQIELPKADTSAFAPFVSKSAEMRLLCERLEQLALTDEAVLILGERGAGKRQAAQILHRLSSRKERPFVALDCSSGASAKLEQSLLGDPPSGQSALINEAVGGTVLLEYIEDLPPPLCPVVLRLIKARELVCSDGKQAQRADVRVLATSRALPEILPDDDPVQEEWKKTLAAISLRVPPLRERRADLLPLIKRFLYRNNSDSGAELWELTARAYDVLERYAWPSNVEELEQVLGRAMQSARGRRIDLADLPGNLIEKVTQLDKASQLQLMRNELKGKSFRDYIRLKQQELAPLLRKRPPFVGS